MSLEPVPLRLVARINAGQFVEMRAKGHIGRRDHVEHHKHLPLGCHRSGSVPTRSCHASIMAILFPGIRVSANDRPGNMRPPHICALDMHGGGGYSGKRPHWTPGSCGTPQTPPSWLPPFWVSTRQVLANAVPFATGLTTLKPSALCRWYNNHCARTRLPVLPVIPGCHRRYATPGTEASVCSPLCPAHGSICVHLVAAHTTEPGTVRTHHLRTHHLTPVSADGPTRPSRPPSHPSAYTPSR